MHLDGQIAIVLGASAERGSGWAIAERLAAEGAQVLVAARRLPQIEALARKIGGSAAICDAGVEEQVAALARHALDRYGRLDIAVNAAGLAVAGSVASCSDAVALAAMQVNYLGNLYFLRHMAAAMQAGGSIVLVSSMAATHQMLYNLPYACSKAALDCLVRYAADEFGPRRIKVNSILPGAIKSEMSAGLWQIEGMEDAFVREVPLGRLALPADVADAVLWLAGPSFVTGLNLHLSGGNQLTRFPRLDERPAMEPGSVPTAPPQA